MSKDKPVPRMPEVGEYVRGVGTLVELLTVDPPPQPPPTQDYVFEIVTARCEVRRNDEVFMTFESVWDYYGKETSVEAAIEAAKEWADAREVGPSSDIEVVAIKIVERIRMQPSGLRNHYDDRFKMFESLQIGCKWNMPDPVETVVWSSKGEHNV